MAGKVCPNDKRIPIVVNGTCQISRCIAEGAPSVDERDRKGVERGETEATRRRDRDKERERERALRVRGGNSEAWDLTCIGAPFLAKKGRKSVRGGQERAEGSCHRPARVTSLLPRWQTHK